MAFEIEKVHGNYLLFTILFVVVKQTVEPITHMPPTTDVHDCPHTGSTSQCGSWTKLEVKKWLTEKNLSDIAKK